MSDADPEPGLDLGTPGASARREHERRRMQRERRVRAKHPRIGGVLLALQNAPRDEQAWATGAAGEDHVAQSLARRLGDSAVVLHDRRLPRSRVNVDHIAIGPSGVWVVDAKRYQGRIAVTRPLFGTAKLTIAGRDKTALVQGLTRQVTAVGAALREVDDDAPLHGALCFVDADLPLLRTPTIDGCSLLHPRALARRIGSASVPLAPERIASIAAHLAERFPPAVGP